MSIFDDGFNGTTSAPVDGARLDLDSTIDAIERALRYSASIGFAVASQAADDGPEGAELLQGFAFLLGHLESAGRAAASARARLDRLPELVGANGRKVSEGRA